MSLSVSQAMGTLGGPAAKSEKVRAYLTALKNGGLEFKPSHNSASLDIHFNEDRLGNMHVDSDGKLCFESHLAV